MSWVDAAPQSRSPLEAYFGHRPELLEQFRGFYGALWDEHMLDPALLEMIRLVIARIHKCDAELAIRHDSSGLSDAKRAALADWRASDLFDASEQACLAYVERMPFEHTAISDDEADAVRAALGEPGYVALSVAASLFDALCRVRLVLDLDQDPGDPAQPPASATGVLR